MNTFQSVLARHGVRLPAGLIADAEVPVLTGPQRQGDVGVFPRQRLTDAERSDAVIVPAEGIAVVRGEAATGANTHWLNADGDVLWVPATQDGEVLLGAVEVQEGSVAYLIHEDEHGCNGIGPGVYRLVGKREQASELRRVVD